MWENLYPYSCGPVFSYCYFLLPFVIRFDDFKRENTEIVAVSWAHALSSNYSVFIPGQFSVAGINQTPMQCQAQCLGQSGGT